MNGTLTRNEGRLMEDRDPLPGLDAPLRMLNMVTETDAQEEQDEEEAEEAAALLAPALAAPEPAEPDPADARLRAMAGACAERVARKEAIEIVIAMGERDWRAAVAEMFIKHIKFVSQTMGVSVAAAGAYVTIRSEDPLEALTPQSDIYNAALARLTKLALEGSA
jgi:hypothetical protein